MVQWLNFINKENNVGESSMLDTLNIFFNEKEYKLSSDNFCRMPTIILLNLKFLLRKR